ncbi:hypothetical protein AS030_17705 [Fictibacillus enclensis]|uniref:Uncharacterized protein n=1 Tax=Fictibacillus enclensis TaxID=1017270 RepID=A0A0V8J4S7_9BACL|nr:hypothetical protein AS030_17705 [Fictibacillus enclensis]
MIHLKHWWREDLIGVLLVISEKSLLLRAEEEGGQKRVFNKNIQVEKPIYGWYNIPIYHLPEV